MVALALCPTGARIRRAGLSDVPALARVRAASWQHAYRELLPAAELARVTPARSAPNLARVIRGGDRRRSRILVVVDGADPFGYAIVGPQPDAGLRHRGFHGEVYELYLHPDHQRRGAGRALLSAAIWDLVEHRQHAVLVWVLADNPAWRFYEACGGIEIAAGPIDVGGITTGRVAYGWAQGLPLPCRPVAVAGRA